MRGVFVTDVMCTRGCYRMINNEGEHDFMYSKLSVIIGDLIIDGIEE